MSADIKKMLLNLKDWVREIEAEVDTLQSKNEELRQACSRHDEVKKELEEEIDSLQTEIKEWEDSESGEYLNDLFPAETVDQVMKREALARIHYNASLTEIEDFEKALKAKNKNYIDLIP